MKMLTAEITKLLDKLYNLRGEDSVILRKMDEERRTAEETKERTTSEKTELQERITRLTEEERVLAEEGEKLVSTLSRIKTEDFKIVLEKLNVDFNPDKLSEEINGLLPRTIDKAQQERKAAEEGLVKVQNEMDMAVATIEELAIRRDEAVSDQARLNEYFELALNGNINITRDSITSLLAKFNFTEDEQREAAKIMMFPEDALFDYESRLKNKEQSGKSISEVFAEAKENIEKEKDKSVSPKEELLNLLTELGFDTLDFTTSDIDKVLANYNESDLRRNVLFAKNKGLDLDMFVDNVSLLYDVELEDKINKLLEVGKEPIDIYLNPNILIKYSKKDIEDIINKLRSSGLNPMKVPLIAY